MVVITIWGNHRLIKLFGFLLKVPGALYIWHLGRDSKSVIGVKIFVLKFLNTVFQIPVLISDNSIERQNLFQRRKCVWYTARSWSADRGSESGCNSIDLLPTSKISIRFLRTRCSAIRTPSMDTIHQRGPSLYILMTNIGKTSSLFLLLKEGSSPRSFFFLFDFPALQQ